MLFSDFLLSHSTKLPGDLKVRKRGVSVERRENEGEEAQKEEEERGG